MPNMNSNYLEVFTEALAQGDGYDARLLTMVFSQADFNGNLAEQLGNYVSEANFSDLASCHPAAEMVVAVMGTGDTANHGPARIDQVEEVQAVVEAGRAAIASGENCIVHVQYDHPEHNGHSFVLMCSANRVYSFETWTGGAVAEIDDHGAVGEGALMFHQTVVIAPRYFSRNTARNNLVDLADQSVEVRRVAYETLCRASLAATQGDADPAEMQITVNIRLLRTPPAAYDVVLARLQALALAGIAFDW